MKLNVWLKKYSVECETKGSYNGIRGIGAKVLFQNILFCLLTQSTFSARMLYFPNSDHLMFSREFASCLFVN